MENGRVKDMYNAAKRDKGFIADIKSADNDNPPGIFCTDLDKAIFAATYYGYSVGKYGDNWEAKSIGE